MSGLRCLQLALPSGISIDTALFKFRQVFPTDGTQWTRLNKFHLASLAISAKDVVLLLAARMPNLRELTFWNVQLLEGRWEGVIEFLKLSMKLLSFPLYDISQLRHLGGKDFLNDNGRGENVSGFRTDIEKYVVSGGRHPCLRPDEDPSVSRNYLLDLDL